MSNHSRHHLLIGLCVMILLLVTYLLLLGTSYSVAVYTARLGAWIATLWRQDE